MSLSISNSCASTFMECEFKGCLKYLAKVQKDADAVEPDYFKMGNAFHKVLELTFHFPDRFNKINFPEIIKSFGLDPVEDGAKIMAMLRVYWALHSTIPLKVVAVETKITGSVTNGVVDCIMQELGGVTKYMLSGVAGAWWIVDLKTASKAEMALPARMHKDQQLNLYASFGLLLAEKYNLDPKLFAGIRLREATKPGQVYKAGESLESYTKRCISNVREIVVPASQLDLKTANIEFTKIISKINELERDFAEKKELVGIKNQKACLGWGRACEYFSWCNGKTFTECMSNAMVNMVVDGEVKSLNSIIKDIENTQNTFKKQNIEVALDEFC